MSSLENRTYRCAGGGTYREYIIIRDDDDEKDEERLDEEENGWYSGGRITSCLHEYLVFRNPNMYTIQQPI